MLERAPSQEVRRGSSARERRKPRARPVPIIQGSRRFVRARAPEARLAGGCSRVPGARSAGGCSRGVWCAGMRGGRRRRVRDDHPSRTHLPIGESRTGDGSRGRAKTGSNLVIFALGRYVFMSNRRWRERACGISGKTPCGQALRSPRSPAHPAGGTSEPRRSQRGFALLSGPTQPIPTCRPAYEHSACSYAPPQENAKQTTRRMTRKTPLYRVNCARNVRDVWRASSGRPGNDARTMRK